MSKEEALLFQKALISSKERQIKFLKEELLLAYKEIDHLKTKLGPQINSIKTDIEVTRLAATTRRNRLKRQRKELYK